MSKNVKNIELKIYELLGIKIFRKMAFVLRNILAFPFTIFMSKEDRKNFYNSPSNYNMKKGHGKKDLIDFKKMLLFNSLIHIFLLCICLLSIFSGVCVTISQIINISLATIINSYCIMLQRYNHVRINQVIKKMEVQEEIKKDELKEELIEKDILSNNCIYKVVNEYDKEKDITFEEFLEMATYKSLKDYQQQLLYFKSLDSLLGARSSEFAEFWIEQNMNISLGKNKRLKLALKQNNEIRKEDKK